MKYLVQPRGPGKAWAFRMRTPPALIGKVDPETGKPFGAIIKRGLGTDHLPTARMRRDETLGRVRAAVRATAEAGLSAEDAARWAQEIAAQERDMGPEDVPIRAILHDMVEEEAAQAKRRGDAARAGAVDRFRDRVVNAGHLRLSDAVERYLAARVEGNRSGYRPLAARTAEEVRTAVKALGAFCGDADATLRSITHDKARKFRTEWLPERGLSPGTTRKNIAMLAGMWAWAIETRHVDGPSPWKAEERLVPRASAGAGEARRGMFEPAEAAAILAAAPLGTPLGDAFRLALVTGCRLNEVATLSAEALTELAGAPEDGNTGRKAQLAGFMVGQAKTAAGRRWVPVPEMARAILERSGRVGRLFPEFSVTKTGRAKDASDSFTTLRREALGAGTDGRLAMHSTRHTWRTVARRARVAEDVIRELGGWSKGKDASRIYDHGLDRGALAAAQEAIAGALGAGGWLKGW